MGECSAFVLKMRKERVKQETASLLSTVARGILPKELAISPPEWFLLADSGANVHVLYDRTLLAFEKEANRFLGWGRGGDTCIAVGQLCCVTYMLHNNRWEKIVLHSGQPDTTWVVPVANRPLFSTIQARRQGQARLGGVGVGRLGRVARHCERSAAIQPLSRHCERSAAIHGSLRPSR